MSAMTTRRTEPVTCGDAGQMDLHVWTPDAGGSAAILLIQEIFGVGPYIRDVAKRLADAGYVVGAPDVFWRFAPGWEADHTEAGLGSSIEKVQNLDFQLAVGDCVAALARLGELGGVTRAPGVLGFCLGGTLAWGVAVTDEPSVCVSYYGSGVPSMIEMIERVQCPALFHFGNDDSYISNDGVDAVGAAIAGREGFAINVENAGHAFDNHEAPMFYNESAANAAWAKTMAFLTHYLPPA
jgi:carboxymethylenebutenolidase